MRALLAALLITTASCNASLAQGAGARGAIESSETYSAASKAQPAQYPKQLRGHWMPDDMRCSSPINCDSESLPNPAMFPKELRGTWGLSSNKCRAIKTNDSDSRIEIEAHGLQGYENRDVIESIEKIAGSPIVWRIVTVSNIAPPEIQGGAEIYILSGDRLTVTDGESIHGYVRCKGSAASAADKKQLAQYPREIRGHWIPSDFLGIDSTCKLAERLESDSLIEIKAQVIVGYEESSKPLKVGLLSKQPMVWRITSVTDIGYGYEPDADAIYAIGKGMLTVITTDRVTRYTKCL